MAVTYSLGKDASITGVTNTNVRSVTATVEGSQIDVTRRGHTQRKYKPGFKEASIEIEMIESPPTAGAELTITHDNSGLSGTFIVTSVATNEPLDDVVTYSVTCKMKTAPS
jgi:hypothetical protein